MTDILCFVDRRYNQGKYTESKFYSRFVRKTFKRKCPFDWLQPPSKSNDSSMAGIFLLPEKWPFKWQHFGSWWSHLIDFLFAHFILHLESKSLQMQHENIFQELDNELKSKSFFAGDTLTVADIIIFMSLFSSFSKKTYQDKEKFVNLSRWYRFIYVDNNSSNSVALFSRSLLYT